MAGSFLVVPEWQGSGSSRAMRLIDGAEAIRGDLPAGSTRVVDVPLEAGDDQGTHVHRASSLRLVHEQVLEALEDLPAPVIAIGGDCGISLGAIAHANDAVNGELAVVWFDAHPDLNSVASSPSGIFNGMVLRALTGDGVDGLVPTTAVRTSNVLLAGTRSIDPGEQEFIDDHGIRVLSVDDLADRKLLLDAVAATGASAVYLHIDIDVLDPSEVAGLDYPVPFGLSVETLTARIRDLGSAYSIAGASITEFAPASPEAALDDLPAILRIIAALTA